MLKLFLFEGLSLQEFLRRYLSSNSIKTTTNNFSTFKQIFSRFHQMSNINFSLRANFLKVLFNYIKYLILLIQEIFLIQL